MAVERRLDELADLLEEPEVAVPGVVHDDVELPEMRVGLLHGREVGGAVGHVEFDGQEGVPVDFQVVEGAEGAGGGGDAVPALQGGECEFPAEAA